MRSLSLRLPLAVLLLLTFLYDSVAASVLAIDYGSDWIKASLMKPGVPFDVLLNKDSKRKIQSSVGWKKSDRLFGSDAYNIVSVNTFVVTCDAKPWIGGPFPPRLLFIFEIFGGSQLRLRTRKLFCQDFHSRCRRDLSPNFCRQTE